MSLNEQTYHKLFVDTALVSEEDFARARDESAGSGRPIEAAIVDLGIATNEVVGDIMSKAYGVPFVNLLQTEISADALALLPDALVRKRWVLPYDRSGDHVQIAMVDPQNVELLAFIEKRIGLPFKVSYVTPGIFEDALRSQSQDTIAQIHKLSEGFEKMHEGHREGKPTGEEDVHVVEITDLVLQWGYANNASDVHIEPKENLCLVRYRIDGVLHDVLKLSMALGVVIVSRIKIMSNLRTDEHFAPQDGKFRAHFGNKSVDIRVSILPVVEGEKVVLRILSEKGHTFTLSTLGFSDEDFARVKRAAAKPYGMILSTGPTGAGKTTTMYTVLKILNSREVNIQTIEDPVEYELEGANQIQVNPLTDLTFASGLRSIVRQDPDIIMVGEIRDTETAQLATQAALTGHLVLSTLHTNDAATTIPRLLDLGVEPFLIASSVNVVIAQRLVRHNCPHCTEPVSVDLLILKDSIPDGLRKKYFGDKEKMKLSQGKGCKLCNKTGFEGRVGIFEVLEMSEPIRELVMHRATADLIAKKAAEEGMTGMLEDGIRKAIDGVTTIEEVLKNATVL